VTAPAFPGECSGDGSCITPDQMARIQRMQPVIQAAFDDCVRGGMEPLEAASFLLVSGLCLIQQIAEPADAADMLREYARQFSVIANFLAPPS